MVQVEHGSTTYLLPYPNAFMYLRIYSRAAVPHDGKYLATMVNRSSLQIWGLQEEKGDLRPTIPLSRTQSEQLDPNTPVFSLSGDLIAIGGNVSSTTFSLARLFGGTAQSRTLGGYIVIADASSCEKLWSGRVTRNSPVYAVAFSPGRKYVTASTKWAKARVTLWRIRRPEDRASPVGTSF